VRARGSGLGLRQEIGESRENIQGILEEKSKQKSMPRICSPSRSTIATSDMTRWNKDSGSCSGLRYPMRECVPLSCLISDYLTPGSHTPVSAGTGLQSRRWDIHILRCMQITSPEYRRLFACIYLKRVESVTMARISPLWAKCNGKPSGKWGTKSPRFSNFKKSPKRIPESN
jgi:hypothetical protein